MHFSKKNYSFSVVPGYFSRNGFVMVEPTMKINYKSWEPLITSSDNLENIKNNLHVRSLMNISTLIEVVFKT